MKNWLRLCWNNIRRLSGDDAYERYLLQYAEHIQMHSDDENNSQSANSDLPHSEPALSRKEFFKQWQDGKWKGIKRCC